MTPVLELEAILVENGEGGQSRLPSSDMATRLATKPRPKTRSDGPIVSFPNSSSRHTGEIHPPYAASSYSRNLQCRIRVRNSLNEIDKGKLTRQTDEAGTGGTGCSCCCWNVPQGLHCPVWVRRAGLQPQAVSAAR